MKPNQYLLRVLLAFCVLLLPLNVNSQEKYERLRSIVSEYGIESDSTLLFLQQWEKDEPDNAEMLYSWYVYYVIRGTAQIELADSLTNFDFDKNAMLPDTLSQFKNLRVTNINMLKDHGNGMELYKKGIEFIDRDIELHPRIFELYCNKIEGLYQKYEFKYVTSEAIKLARLYHGCPDGWVDFYGKSLDNDSVALGFNDTMKSVIGMLMASNEAELAGILTDSLISFYPDNVAWKTYKCSVYMMSYQLDKAISYSSELLKTYPGNAKVLYVITESYILSGDTKNAEKYATELSQCDDAEMADQGKQLLEMLKVRE